MFGLYTIKSSHNDEIKYISNDELGNQTEMTSKAVGRLPPANHKVTFSLEFFLTRRIPRPWHEKPSFPEQDGSDGSGATV